MKNEKILSTKELVNSGLITEYASVYSTTKYDLFNTLKGNRPVNKLNVERLKKSIETVGYVGNSPIIVNEKFEIIDGQARFEALKQLNKSIYFMVVEGLTISTILQLNAEDNTRWNSRDYVLAYADMGDESFILLDKLLNTYTQLNLNSIGYVLYGKPISAYKLRNGDYSLTQENFDKVQPHLGRLNEYANIIYKNKRYISGAERLVCAIAEMLYASTLDKDGVVSLQFDDNRLKRAIVNILNTDIKIKIVSVEDALMLIEKSYNKNAPSEERIDLVNTHIMLNKRETRLNNKVLNRLNK